MATGNDQKLQVLYSFIAAFDTLRGTVREMALNGEASDYKKAELICEMIGSFVYGKESFEALRSSVADLEVSSNVKPIAIQLIKRMDKDKESILADLEERYKTLVNLLMLRDAIMPNEGKGLEPEAVKAYNESELIKKNPGHPIKPSDYAVMHDIASANVEMGVMISEVSRRFKAPEVKDKIKRLYHEAPYYFEQSFSNTDIRIQQIILEIIEEDIRKYVKDEVRMQALQDLKDLHTLSTIDTSANKMTSKVSDHQAFELFLQTLQKNNNDFLIKKLLADDVIISTLFDISSQDKENYYGLRRMFTVAKFPYDGIILNRYKSLKKVSDNFFKGIIDELKKDHNFKETYDKYEKTERTTKFIEQMKIAKSHLYKSTLVQESVYELCYVLDEFTKPEIYNMDVLTPTIILGVIDEIYWYLIQNDAYGDYPLLETSMRQFFSYRIDNALNSSRLEYQSFGGNDTFGILPSDIWFDLNCMVREYGFDDVKRIYLRYGSEEVYVFEIGGPVDMFEGNFNASDVRGTNDGSYSFLCANQDNKGFEQYVFNLYGKFIKTFMANHIITTVKQIKSSGFRKVETPGISDGDDKKFKKVITEYMTLQYLWRKDPKAFLYVYQTRVPGLMKAVKSMEVKGKELMKYVRVTSNEWVLNLFLRRARVLELLETYEQVVNAGKENQYIEHGNALLTVATNITISEEDKDV